MEREILCYVTSHSVDRVHKHDGVPSCDGWKGSAMNALYVWVVNEAYGDTDEWIDSGPFGDLRDAQRCAIEAQASLKNHTSGAVMCDATYEIRFDDGTPSMMVIS